LGCIKCNKHRIYIFKGSDFKGSILEWNLVKNKGITGLKNYSRKEHLEFLKINHPEYFFN